MEELDVGPKEAISHYRQLLKHSDAAYRIVAAKWLGDIGPDAKESLPDLTLLLQDVDSQVRRAAEWAIKKIERRG